MGLVLAAALVCAAIAAWATSIRDTVTRAIQHAGEQREPPRATPDPRCREARLRGYCHSPVARMPILETFRVTAE